MEIAVLGGGNGAYAAAADLAEQGHRIRLWRRDRRALAPVLESRAITLLDARGRRAASLDVVTTELEERLGLHGLGRPALRKLLDEGTPK